MTVLEYSLFIVIQVFIIHRAKEVRTMSTLDDAFSLARN